MVYAMLNCATVDAQLNNKMSPPIAGWSCTNRTEGESWSVTTSQANPNTVVKNDVKNTCAVTVTPSRRYIFC